MHILIVEDETMVRDSLTRVLAHAGHTTCWAATGASAIRLLESEPIDLVLLDLCLGPGISGLDVARYKIEHESLRHVPMIIVTGLSTDKVHERAQVNPLQGALLTLSKPVDIDLLLRAIRSLDGHRTEQRTEQTKG
jgi:DNA-binding response OmpR family regulator